MKFETGVLTLILIAGLFTVTPYGLYGGSIKPSPVIGQETIAAQVKVRRNAKHGVRPVMVNILSGRPHPVIINHLCMKIEDMLRYLRQQTFYHPRIIEHEDVCKTRSGSSTRYRRTL